MPHCCSCRSCNIFLVDGMFFSSWWMDRYIFFPLWMEGTLSRSTCFVERFSCFLSRLSFLDVLDDDGVDMSSGKTVVKLSLNYEAVDGVPVFWWISCLLDGVILHPLWLESLFSQAFLCISLKLKAVQVLLVSPAAPVVQDGVDVISELLARQVNQLQEVHGLLELQD